LKWHVLHFPALLPSRFWWQWRSDRKYTPLYRILL